MVDVTGKGILFTLYDMTGPYKRTLTCYICNNKGHIKDNCWFNPLKKHRHEQFPRVGGSGMNPHVSRPVYFVEQQQPGSVG